jgi:hypothetical protein
MYAPGIRLFALISATANRTAATPLKKGVNLLGYNKRRNERELASLSLFLSSYYCFGEKVAIHPLLTLLGLDHEMLDE